MTDAGDTWTAAGAARIPAGGSELALKPTIYKFDLTLADMDRNCYESRSLTVAQHPSETLERMMVRVLAYSLFHDDRLVFARGLSEDDEPDLWQKSLDGRIERWIEVGEPSLKRLKRAHRLADEVAVIAFNRRTDVWWKALSGRQPPAAVYCFDWVCIQRLAGLIGRTGELGVTIDRPSVFVAAERGEIELQLETLAPG